MHATWGGGGALRSKNEDEDEGEDENSKEAITLFETLNSLPTSLFL